MSVKCEQQTMINSTKSFTSILCRMIIIVHSRRSLSFCVSIYELLLDENEENRRRAIKRTINDYANKTRTHSLHFVGSREFCFILKHVDREYVCRLLIIYFDSKDQSYFSKLDVFFLLQQWLIWQSITNTIFAQAVKCVYTFRTCVNKAIYRS